MTMPTVDDAKRDLATVCHWYEEAPNVNSSTRIFAAIMVFCLLVCLALVVAYAGMSLAQKKPIDPQVIHELSWLTASFAASLSVAMGVRNKGT